MSLIQQVADAQNKMRAHGLEPTKLHCGSKFFEALNREALQTLPPEKRSPFLIIGKLHGMRIIKATGTPNMEHAWAIS